jgi:hypothetical protein
VHIERLTDTNGRTKGLILKWRNTPPPLPAGPIAAAQPERVVSCQICSTNEAAIYCRAHGVWLCVGCIQGHELMESNPLVHGVGPYGAAGMFPQFQVHCEYLSRAAARALAG